MKKILFFIFLLTINFSYASIINEIMYNPEGDDNNKEFIEIYSDDYINLSGFIIGDTNSNDTLIEVKYFNSGYSLIVEEGFYYDDINTSVYSAGAGIGNGLGNDGDNITLFYPNGSIIDYINYDDSWGADDDGYSLEKIYINKSNDVSNWAESLYINGTPGIQNSVYRSDESNEEIDYSGIEISEFMPNPEGEDNANMPNGEWIELYNSNNISLDLIGLKFYDNARHNLIITDTTTIDGTVINAYSYLVVYVNGKGGFLNNDEFEKIMLYDGNNLIDEVSYSDSSEGVSWSKINGIWQRSIPTPTGTNNFNVNLSESHITIEEIYDLGSNDKAEWGDVVRIKLNVYKGDTAKSTIKLWVENDERVSKETKFNVYEKFINYSLTLPMQLINNCDEKHKDGRYHVRADGLDKENSERIEISGKSSECKDESKDGKIEYESVLIPREGIFGEEITSKIKVINNMDEDKNVEAWSYVYRGPKSYSGDRKANFITTNVGSGESEVIELKNIVEDGEEGSYKIKINVKRDDVKTPKEFTNEIDLISKNEIANEIALHQGIGSIERNLNTDTDVISGEVVYETSNIKTKRTAIYFFLVLLVLVIITLLKENAKTNNN